MNRDPVLLVMACSLRKNPQLDRGRAWDVYDGRLYQVLKKLLRDHPNWDASLSVLIVSARYGVLGAEDVIEPYEDRLTAALARRRAVQWAPRLRDRLDGRRFRAAHANLGRHYRSAVPELAELIDPTPIEWAYGGIGQRNAATRSWVATQLCIPTDPISGGSP